MTTKPFLFAILASILLFACKKNQTKGKPASDLIAQAQSYFTSVTAETGKSTLATNYRANQQRTIVWDSAVVRHYADGDAVTVPISYPRKLYISSQAAPRRIYRLNDLASLVISRDSTGHFTSAVVTFIPDSLNIQNSPSGTWFIEDWQGRSLYNPIHTAKRGSTMTGTTHSTATTSTKEVDFIESIQVCNEIDGYNYSPDDPSDGVAWSETTCTTYSLPAENPQAGIPPSHLPLPINRFLPVLVVMNPPPNNIIANILDYTKCFTNYGGSDHIYQVTVCVDQPYPGTRQAWGFSSEGVAGSSSGSNPIDVGHTWLVLSENFSDYSIVRNVGFYPQFGVYPWSSSAQGALNNDDGHGYNISLTITVNNGQFFNILNYISGGNNSGYMYDLNSNNCTSFALHALEAGDVNLPATYGSWPDGGFGYDPGDLGEDIRNMPLSSNMTRNTTYSDHPNKYTCN